MVVKGNCLGLAKLCETVTLQPNTQQIVGLQCPKINNQSVFLLEPITYEDTQGFCVPRTILSTKAWRCCQLWNPMDEPITLRSGAIIGQLAPVSDILSVAQDNAPAAITDAPCYLTGKRQGDSRSNGYRNKHRRYSADRVRFPRQILRWTILDIKHKPFILGIDVLRKIIPKEMLKIIIIKIISIHLLLNL